MKYKHSETGKVIDVMEGTKLAKVYVPVTDSEDTAKSKQDATSFDKNTADKPTDLTAAKSDADIKAPKGEASVKTEVKKAVSKASK